METIQSVQKKLKTTSDLLSVVRTMKSLASVNIRGFERAAHALDRYEEIVLLAWTAFLRSGGSLRDVQADGAAVILVLGSDQGMCGQFNDAVTRLALHEADSRAAEGRETAFWSVGERVACALAAEGRPPRKSFSLPGALPGIDAVASEILDQVGERQHEGRLGSFSVAYNTLSGHGSFQSKTRRLLPLDRRWAEELTERRWFSKTLPMLAAPPQELVRSLFAEYLYVSLQRAFAQSLAAESAARLASMQNAEKNIKDVREELTALYRQTRQTAITSELLDIVAGFTALEEDGE